jgi:hypothetical protein
MKTLTGLLANPTEISSAQATEKCFLMNSVTGVISNGCARLIVMLRSDGDRMVGSFSKLTSKSAMFAV